MRYMEYAAPLHEVYEALMWVCLQWATSGFGEEEDDVRREESAGLVWPDE